MPDHANRLVLLTDRLRLRPLEETDVEFAVEVLTNRAVSKYIGGLMSEQEIRRDMKVWTRRGSDGCIGIWNISDRETKEPYGDVFLLPIPTDEDDTEWDKIQPGLMPDGDVEVGYILNESAWGKGYATEACRRLLRFAFEETPLLEVVATLEDEHEASKNVLTKSGLRCRGRRQAYAEDMPDWRISKAEWVALEARPAQNLE